MKKMASAADTRRFKARVERKKNASFLIGEMILASVLLLGFTNNAWFLVPVFALFALLRYPKADPFLAVLITAGWTYIGFQILKLMNIQYPEAMAGVLALVVLGLHFKMLSDLRTPDDTHLFEDFKAASNDYQNEQKEIRRQKERRLSEDFAIQQEIEEREESDLEH